MKILVIGGSRFIGKSIVEEACRKGHEVFLFNRGKTTHNLPVKCLHGDIDYLLDFKEQIRDLNFDVVIHCIAYTEKHGKDLVTLFQKTSTRVIVLSSVDVYDAFYGLNREEDRAELPLNETAKKCSERYYWKKSTLKGDLAALYDKNLVEEKILQAQQRGEIKGTIFRLPMVYGEGDYQYPGRHGEIIRRIIEKEKNLILSDRQQCQLFTFGHVKNIASAVIHSLTFPVTEGKIYNLGEEKTRSLRKWVQLYEEISGWKFDIHILPEEVLRKNKQYRSAPPQNVLVDTSLYRKETNFKEPLALTETLQNTFKYAQENLDCLGEPTDVEKEKDLLENYYQVIENLY